MEFFKNSKQLKNIYDVIGAKNIIWGFSITLCLIAIISLIINGINLSLEFTGGVQLEVRFQSPNTINNIITKLEDMDFKSPKVQNYGSTKDFLIRLNIQNNDQNQSQQQDNEIAKQVISCLTTSDNIAEIRKVEYIGSEVGEKLLEQGTIAVLIAIFATMIYIALRFEYRLAISAAITLFHNAIIVLGWFSVTKCEFDLATLAAVLAVVGYTLNDTIVIFDRIRENFRKYHKETTKEIINIAINQTLSRTIMTSFLTLLVVVSLLLVGGKSLFGFALALTVGILIGTYASIGVAGSVALKIGLGRQDFLKK